MNHNNKEIFEYAARTTFYRWRQDPIQSVHASKNVGYAIQQAIGENKYSGFTSQNNAREYASKLSNDDLSYALFYNMIQLSEYRRVRNGETLGKADSDIMVVVESCKNGDIKQIEQLLKIGIDERLKEINLLRKYPNLSFGEKEEQIRRLKEMRQSKSPMLQRAYDFAENVINCYTEYNTHYQVIDSKKSIQNPYEQRALKGLDNYYSMKYTKQKLLEQSAIEFEDVTKGTLERINNMPERKGSSEQNLKMAIVYAIDQEYYNGFTNRNSERTKAIKMGKEGMEYALLQNMIQMNSYRQDHNVSFGRPDMDSFSKLIADNCHSNQLYLLQELLETGINEIMNINQGKKNEKMDEVAYAFANCVLDSYIKFNTVQGIISPTNLNLTSRDSEALEHLNTYYQVEQVKKQNQNKQSL